MPVRRLSLAALLLTFVLLASCDAPDWHPQPPSPGDSDARLKIELFPSASGSASKTGADAALKTPEFLAISRYVVVESQPDPDNSEDAVRAAIKIRSDPQVLAVVGHSRSGTTRAALPFYAQAGIPVLMPSATSPYALYNFAEHEPWPSVDRLGKEPAYERFPNAFRLPPSDVPDQVDAIRATTKKLAGTDNVPLAKIDSIKIKTKVMIICETTRRDGSDVYTKPMCDSLRKKNDSRFSPLIAGYREIDLDTGDIYGIVTEVHAVKPSLIILVGYSEFARNLLEELKERQSTGGKMSDYTFIASEACFNPDLAQFGSKIYVTSSIDLAAVRCDTPEAQVLREAVKDKERTKPEPTEESFTFDALLILSGAVKDCELTLNRECITRYIENNHLVLQGACQKYFIEKGERQNAKYMVYSNACNGRAGSPLQPVWSVEKGGEQVHGDDKWKCSQSNQ
jgi:ABC-type branched-subunit amino acid transport system substrate-binding protein